MTPQDLAKEDTKTNVVYMGDFLMRRHIRLNEELDRLTGLIEELSNQNKDKFVAPLRAKAEAVNNKMENVARHIRFIMRGGLSVSIPANGYRLHYGQPTPPLVTITVTQPT